MAVFHEYLAVVLAQKGHECGVGIMGKMKGSGRTHGELEQLGRDQASRFCLQLRLNARRLHLGQHPELTLKVTGTVFVRRMFVLTVFANRVALSVSSRMPKTST